MTTFVVEHGVIEDDSAWVLPVVDASDKPWECACALVRLGVPLPMVVGWALLRQHFTLGLALRAIEDVN